jgi:protein-tyrosine phosphatase
MLAWASLSFGLVGLAYLFNKPELFGKNDSGKQNVISIFVLLPYLLYLWGTWRLLRLFKSENAIDQIDETIFIGRRLSKKELPEEIITVVDLTCEFAEDRSIVENTDYHNFQILDASIPKSDKLASFIKKISAINHSIFIHCAEGHGRTALVAVLILVAKGKATSVSDAYKILKTKRPLVKLNRAQRRCAEKTSKLLAKYGLPV